MSEKYRVLDLFAGAGGLSLGFVQNGHFSVKVAIENNQFAQETYLRNHKSVTMLDNVLDINDFSEFNKTYGPFDLIIGGPPCQGFSNANRHRSLEINLNNLLVKKYLDFILNLQPKYFVMENVKGIKSDSKYFFLSKEEFDTYSQNCNVKKHPFEFPASFCEFIENHLNDGAITFFDPQIMEIKRLVNNADTVESKFFLEAFSELHGFFENHPELKQIKEFSVFTDTECVSSFEDISTGVNCLAVLNELATHHIYIESLEKNGEGCRLICRTLKVYDYIIARLSGFYILAPGVYNTCDFGVPQERERFVMIGSRIDNADRPEKLYLVPEMDERRTVRDAIGDLEKFAPVHEVLPESPISVRYPKGQVCFPWQDSSHIFNHVNTCTTPVALERFKLIKQGKNFHSLPDSLKTSYANPSRTQNTVYRRLEYDMPSPTVTNIRKSMWIHPVLDRALSIREAARLQSFPDSFIFCGNKDRQYQQIGNAVPPLFARHIADKIFSLLNEGDGQNENY